MHEESKREGQHVCSRGNARETLKKVGGAQKFRSDDGLAVCLAHVGQVNSDTATRCGSCHLGQQTAGEGRNAESMPFSAFYWTSKALHTCLQVSRLAIKVLVVFWEVLTSWQTLALTSTSSSSLQLFQWVFLFSSSCGPFLSVFQLLWVLLSSSPPGIKGPLLHLFRFHPLSSFTKENHPHGPPPCE